MFWGQPSSGQISMRSAAVTRSSQIGSRSTFAGSLPPWMPLAVTFSAGTSRPRFSRKVRLALSGSQRPSPSALRAVDPSATGGRPPACWRAARRVLNGRLGDDQAATDSCSGVVGRGCGHGPDALAPGPSEQHGATSTRLAIRGVRVPRTRRRSSRLQGGRGMVVTRRGFGYEAVSVTERSSASSERCKPASNTSRSGQRSRSATTVTLNWPA
jgi:hypothetical protein